jgi:hypothetical protein
VKYKYSTNYSAVKEVFNGANVGDVLEEIIKSSEIEQTYTFYEYSSVSGFLFNLRSAYSFIRRVTF